MLLLTSNLVNGCLGLLFTFLFCFLAVHAPAIIKKYRKNSVQTPPLEPSEKEEKAEPIYYIVEKKKRKIKTNYSEPKRINFK